MKKNKNRNYFFYLRLVKFALIGILFYTVIAVIYTYYSYKNLFSKDSFVESGIKKKSLKHDIIDNPSFYDFGKDGKKFFVSAVSAKKNQNVIEMDDIKGYFRMDENQNFNFNAYRAEIFTNKNLAIMKGVVNIDSEKNGKINANDVYVYYKEKKITSDKPVMLHNNFADIQAKGFEVKNEKVIVFNGPVKAVILEN